MIRLKHAAIFSLVLLGAVKLAVTPTSVTYQLALPAVAETTPYEEPVYLAEAEYVTVPIPVNYTDEDQKCLAHNIYFESQNQPVAGKIAVGIVTLKRVSDKRFPNTICGVVEHTRYRYASGFPIKNKCQFSWYCDGLSDNPKNRRAYIEAQTIASALLDDESSFVDVTNGADHYHADYIDPPKWASSMIQVASIGNHVFYVSQL